MVCTIIIKRDLTTVKKYVHISNFVILVNYRSYIHGVCRADATILPCLWLSNYLNVDIKCNCKYIKFDKNIMEHKS